MVSTRGLPFALASTLLLLLPLGALAQVAGTTAPLVYTYNGQSAPSSLLNAVSTAGAPARAIGAASDGVDTATAVVAAFPSTSTVGPVTIPGVTSDFAFRSAESGEVLPTETRAAYTAVGTIATSLLVTGPTATAATAGGGRTGGGVGAGVMLVGVVVGACL